MHRCTDLSRHLWRFLRWLNCTSAATTVFLVKFSRTLESTVFFCIWHCKIQYRKAHRNLKLSFGLYITRICLSGDFVFCRESGHRVKCRENADKSRPSHNHILSILEEIWSNDATGMHDTPHILEFCINANLNYSVNSSKLIYSLIAKNDV